MGQSRSANGADIPECAMTQQSHKGELARITSPEGWCICPCHSNDQILHVAECCRRCGHCGHGVPLGIDEHICRRTEPVSETLRDDLKKTVS